MLGLMEYVLCDKDDIDIAMMTAFLKKIAHSSIGIRVVQQVQPNMNRHVTPRGFLKSTGTPS